MKRYLIIFAALSLVSCSKAASIDHPLEAEFGQSVGHVQDKVVFLDLSGSTLTESEYVAELGKYSDCILIARTNTTLFGSDCESWVKSNCAKWSHKKSAAVADSKYGYIGSGKDDTIYFESFKMNSAYALMCMNNGVSYVLASPSSGDINRLLPNIRSRQFVRNWVLALNMQTTSTVLEGASFTECINAQYGHNAPPRTIYLYASPGVWNLMEDISLDPLRFTINTVL